MGPGDPSFPGWVLGRVTGGLCAFPPSTWAEDTVKLAEAVMIFRPYLKSMLFTFGAAALWSLGEREQLECSPALYAQHGPGPSAPRSPCDLKWEKYFAREAADFAGLLLKSWGAPTAVTRGLGGTLDDGGGDRNWSHQENNRSDSSYLQLVFFFLIFSPTDLAYKSFLPSKKEMAVLFLLNCSGI